MAQPADTVSVMFQAGEMTRVPEGVGRSLAGHLVGRTLERGQHVALPGWPTAIVESVEPDPGEVVPGTQVDVHVPPPTTEGALSLAIVVDASLTMGQGDPSSYEEAAAVADAVVLNGRAFLQAVGLVVQGGETREAGPLEAPQDVTGASILKVRPRGTFDALGGLQAGLDLLEDAPDGPRAVLLVTDEADALADPIEAAAPLLRAGVALFAVTPEPGEALGEACRWTGGLADTDAGPVFEAMAALAGTRATWTPPQDIGTDDGHEFEVVIEAMEGPR